jgi:hypothetical protein
MLIYSYVYAPISVSLSTYPPLVSGVAQVVREFNLSFCLLFPLAIRGMKLIFTLECQVFITRHRHGESECDKEEQLPVA